VGRAERAAGPEGGSEAIPITPSEGLVIEAEGLRKSYNGALAVDGVSFRIGAGEIFGFLGPNGAGKTTTMRMLYGLASPTGGTLRILGRPFHERDRDLKRHIGVVPQETNLDPDLTVLDNLTTWARFYGYPREEGCRRARDLIAFVELTEKSDARVEHLSGGMKRRLLIARALMSDPRILILDEPTTGLDPQSRSLLWEKVRALKAQGKTIILTTHYMDEAEKLCDRLVIMERGRIIREGHPRDLVRDVIGREVLELRVPASEHSRLLQALGEAAQGADALGDNLYLPTENGEDLLVRVKRTGVALESAYYRRAGLEDVFLKLTGRRLEEE